MMRASCPLVVAALIVALTASVALAQGPVALLNADFEQPDPDREGMPLGWGTYPGSPVGDRMQFIWTDDHAHSGERSVSIVVSERNTSWLPSDTSQFATTLDAEDLADAAVPRPPAIVGHRYTLSAWVRAEGSARTGAALVLRWTNEDGWVPRYHREYFEVEGDGWQRIAVSMQAPEGSRWVVPILQVSGNDGPGRIWFDDVSVVDTTGVSLQIPTEPELTDADGSWHTEAVVAGRPAQPLPLRVQIAPEGAARPSVVEAELTADRPLRAPLDYRARGEHAVRYIVTSADGDVYFTRELRVPGPLQARLLSPRYRNTLHGSAEGREIRVGAHLNVANELRQRLTLRAELQAGPRPGHTVDRPERTTMLTLRPAGPVPEGDHPIAVRLLAGEATVAESTLTLHVRPDLRPAVRIDDNNNLLVEGEPSIPVGFYSAPGEDYPMLAREGFNTVLLYTTDLAQCEARANDAADAGLRVIVSSLRPFVADRDAEGARAAAERLRDNPGMLGYYLWDEPSPSREHQAPEDMRWLHEQAMAHDPNHLTTIVFCRPSEFELYAHTTDVYLVDPYVCHQGQETDMLRVADWVEQARAAVDDRKPVWLVPQAFEHFLGPGTYRMPTNAEQRCMCYLGLTHGAKGIIWFVYTGYCIHSEQIRIDRGLPPGQAAWAYRGTIPDCLPLSWQGITRIVREVNELEPVLLAPDPPQAQRVVAGEPAVHTLLKVYDGRGYLIAVNTRNEPVDLRCELPAAGEVEVMWEDRSLALDDGAMVDSFEPWGVHVYRFEPAQ